MKIKLSDSENNPMKLIALENYCRKNDKLLCLRDMKNRLIAVGLSIKALQTSKSKEGFNHYNVIYKNIAVNKSIDMIENPTEKEKKYYETLKKNNFIEKYPIYDIYICVYEGMIKHEQIQNLNREKYWHECYLYYQKNKEKFTIFDLINKRKK